MIQERPSWLGRPAIIAGVAFVLGAIVAGVLVAIVLTSGDDDGAGGRATPEGSATPATASGSTTPEATPTPGNPRDPDDALANYVHQELDETYIGPCPQEVVTPIPQGVCSIELYRSDQQVAFFLGTPFSEGTSEALLLIGEDGVWNVTLIPATREPPALGGEAAVIGAGDCLTFRAAPGRTQQALTCQIDGTRGEVIGGPQTVEDITWWQLKDLGWASGEFLEKAP